MYTPSPALQYLPSNYPTSYYIPQPVAMKSEPEILDKSEPERHDDLPIKENNKKDEVKPENKNENIEEPNINYSKKEEVISIPEDSKPKKAAKIIRPVIKYYCGELENDDDTILNPDWREQKLLGIGNPLLNTEASISLKGKQKTAGEPIKELNELFDDKDDQKDFDFNNTSKNDEKGLKNILEAEKIPSNKQKPQSNEATAVKNLLNEATAVKNLNFKPNERPNQPSSPEVVEEDSPEVIEDDDEDY